MKKAPLRLAALSVLLAFPAGVFAQSAAQKDGGKKKADAPASMKFATDEAPKPIGRHSQAVIEGGFLFASGQIPLDPKTADLVGGTIDRSTVIVAALPKGAPMEIDLIARTRR